MFHSDPASCAWPCANPFTQWPASNQWNTSRLLPVSFVWLDYRRFWLPPCQHTLPCGFTEASCHPGEGDVRKNQGQPLTNSQLGTKELSPVGQKEANPDHHHVNELGFGSFPILASDKTSVPAKSLMGAACERFQLSCAPITTQRNWRHKCWLLKPLSLWQFVMQL